MEIKEEQIEGYIQPSTFFWFSMMTDGVVVLDRNMNVIFVNDSYLKMSGKERDQVLGLHIPSAAPKGLTWHLYESGTPHYGCKHIVGETVASIDIIPYRGNGKVLGTLVIAKKITSPERDEFELWAQGQTLDKILSVFEGKVLEEALNKYGRSVKGKHQAADALGISIATLYNKLKRYHMIEKGTH